MIGSISMLIGLAMLYIAPRLIGLDRLVTTDEPFWLGRSLNFYRALMTANFAQTYQMAHPGVLTMWAGAFAYHITVPDITDFFPRFLTNVYGVHFVLRRRDVDELDLLNTARVIKIGLQSIFIIISLAYLRRVVGPLAAALTGILIALDPFLSGHDSLLHVDGLFAITSFAAVVALASAFAHGHESYLPWIAAGVLAACAWLTRATGIVILGAFVVFVATQAIPNIRHQGLRKIAAPAAFSMMLWGAAAIVTTVALLPAIWVDPGKVLGEMWSWASGAATEGHESPLFFLGAISDGDPGLLFYSVTLIWRLTPITQLGLALLVVVLLMRAPWNHPQTRHTLVLLTIFAVLFLTGMSLGAKKFDRYILPVYPILDTFAAVGYATAAGALIRSRPDLRKFTLAGVAVLVLFGQGWSTMSVLPYRLDYFNPLLGGPTAAEDVLQMGWGEGLDKAAAFIVDDVNQRHPEPGSPEEPRATVRYAGAGGPLVYLLPSDIEVQHSGFGLEAWAETDYFVTTIQSWQRSISPTTTYLEAFPAMAVFEVEGVEFVRVYDLNSIPPPASLLEQNACTHDFQTALRLQTLKVTKGDINVYWIGLDTTDAQRLQVKVDFIPRQGQRSAEPLRSVSTEVEPEGPGMLTHTMLPLPIRSPGTDIDQYWLDITLTNAETGETIPASHPGAMLAEESAVMLPNCRFQSTSNPPASWGPIPFGITGINPVSVA